MRPDVEAGAIAGLVAAFPYLVLMVIGLMGWLRGQGTRTLQAIFHLVGAALGAFAGGMLLAMIVFVLLWWTGLSREPSTVGWGLALGVPTLLVGVIGFLGTVRDQQQERFLSLFIGVFLTILGFCILPMTLIVFLVGMIFGSDAGTL